MIRRRDDTLIILLTPILLLLFILILILIIIIMLIEPWRDQINPAHRAAREMVLPNGIEATAEINSPASTSSRKTRRYYPHHHHHRAACEMGSSSPVECPSHRAAPWSPASIGLQAAMRLRFRRLPVHRREESLFGAILSHYHSHSHSDFNSDSSSNSHSDSNSNSNSDPLRSKSTSNSNPQLNQTHSRPFQLAFSI